MSAARCVAALLLLALAAPAVAQESTFLARRHGSELWGLAQGRLAGIEGRPDLVVGGAPGSVFVISDGGSPSSAHPELPTELELVLGTGHKVLATGWLRTRRNVECWSGAGDRWRH
jgi:hypothetical protein